ncbi:unnamed protein product, partial [Scytosiphon promiscuus]
DRLIPLSVYQPSFVSAVAGGNFIWPGVEVGHVQTVQGLETLGSIDMKTL